MLYPCSGYIRNNVCCFLRKFEYEYKIIRLQKMIEREAGFSVSLERAPNGALIVPQELVEKVPNILQ